MSDATRGIALVVSLVSILCVSSATGDGVSIPAAVAGAQRSSEILIESVLRAGPEESAGALIELGKNSASLLSIAHSLLTRLSECEGEIDPRVFDQPLLSTRHMGFGGFGNRFILGEDPGQPKVLIVVAWASQAIADAPPSHDRRVVVRALLRAVEDEMGRNPNRLLVKAAAPAVFFHDLVIPEDGVDEFVAMVDRIIERSRSDERYGSDAMRRAVADAVFPFLRLCLDDAQRMNYILEHRGYFGEEWASDTAGWFEGRHRQRGAMDPYVPEAWFREVQCAAPEQLVEMLKSIPDYKWSLNRQSILHDYLVGSRKLLEQNFDLVYPIMEEEVLDMDCLLSAAASPIGQDASPRQKAIQDAILDLMFRKIRKGSCREAYAFMVFHKFMPRERPSPGGSLHDIYGLNRIFAFLDEQAVSSSHAKMALEVLRPYRPTGVESGSLR